MNSEEQKRRRVARDLYSTAVRTLLASGYVMSEVDTHPHHIEINCDRPSRLGAMIHYKIAVTPDPTFDKTGTVAVRRNSENEHRALVLVSSEGGSGQISWLEFLGFLGGAIPSWRALSDGYSTALLTAAKNKLPLNMSGEPWAIFEDLAADGLEFCFGRRVGRYGGKRRGLRVSDMIAQLPDKSLLIVDSKAYKSGLDASWPSLRPLCEYVQNQKVYQQGQNEIAAALIISSGFIQDSKGLDKLGQEFLGETRIPLCFITAATLSLVVEEVKQSIGLRSAVRWKSVFVGGLISNDSVLRQIKRVKAEKFEPGED